MEPRMIACPNCNGKGTVWGYEGDEFCDICNTSGMIDANEKHKCLECFGQGGWWEEWAEDAQYVDCMECGGTGNVYYQ